MKPFLLFILLAFSQVSLAQITDLPGVAKQVDSLNQLLFSYIKTKPNNESLELYKKVDSLATILGKETAAYSRTQLYHGMILRAANKRDEAEQVLLEVKNLQEKVIGKEDPDYSITLHELGYLCYFKSDFQNALKYLRQAHYIQEVILGKKDKFYADTLYFLAFLLRVSGNLDEAESRMLQYVAYCKETFGATHYKYGVSLTELGRVYFDKTEYLNAELQYKESIRIIEEAGKGTDGSYGIALNYLGEMYRYIGQLEKAEPLYLKALAFQYQIGAKPRQIAITKQNLASIYDKLGNLKEAERYGLESLNMYEQTIGTNSPNYSVTLSTLSAIYLHQGALDLAEQYIQKALDISAKQISNGYKDYATQLLRRAAIFNRQNRLDNALSDELECKTILEKNNQQEKPLYGSTLIYLTTTYLMKGQYETAQQYASEAKQVYEKTLGKKSTAYSETLRKLAGIYWLMGELKHTLDFLEEASVLDHELLQKTTQYLSEGELSAFSEKFSSSLNTEFSLACLDKSIVSTCYNDILFQKGFLLNNGIQLRRIIKLDTLASSKFEKLKTLRQKLAIQYSIPLAERDSLKVALLEQKVNNLEKELAVETSGYAESSRQINWNEIQQVLQPNEAALEFVQFIFSNPNPTDSILYAALILLKNDPQPLFIPLFEEKQLAPLLKGATGGSNFLKINALYEQPELYNLIWKPLEPALQGITTLYTSPSGLLHRINLAAIRSPNGKTVGETKQLVLMGSTRQLVQPESSTEPYSATAYLAGGIRYHSDSIAIGYALREAGTRGINNTYNLPFPTDAIEARAGDLRYLPATASEVQEIWQSLKNARFEVRKDTGFYATEESFRQLGASEASPTLLHLATHGFFFPDPVRNKNTDGSVFKLSDHPMIRSGLIMAGAQEAWAGKKVPPGREDGILTAYEISQMNLSNTQLVVLSACETGLGDIAGNEGVYGLQRAFKIAGAKYLMMSLWKVDDQKTKTFMTTFYQEWLEQKRSIPDAFRQTQQKMRKTHPNPYDWAGFILIE